MRENIVRITSDFTGNVYEGTDVPAVKITVNGKSGTRDLSPAESEALAAWATADAESLPAARDALRALLAPAAAPAAAPGKRASSGKRASGSKSADVRNTAIREWAGTPEGRAAIGLAPDEKISTRGRLPGPWATAYDAAHGTPAPVAA